MDVTFQHPAYLWLAVAIPVVIVLHIYSLRFTRRKAMLFANFDAIRRAATGVYGGTHISKNLAILLLNLTVILLLIAAAAGMTLWYTGPTSDFDFVFAIDASGSMQADDISPSRLSAAKEASMTFLRDINEGANVGIISFSGVAKVDQRPDSSVQKAIRTIDGIETQYASGTAIGEAIMTATNLFDQTGRSHVIILLTDGQNTVGLPVSRAVEYAKEQKVTIHTVGVATEEGGSFGELISRIDEESLRSIADKTGGTFFKVTDSTDMEEALADIGSSTMGDVPIHTQPIATTVAILLLIIEFALLNTRLRSIP